MRIFHLSYLIIGAVIALCLPLQAEELKWLNFEEGWAKAKAEKKPLLVDFYTNWCGWCKRMDRDTYGNTAVQGKLADKWVLVKVNAESNREFTLDGKTLTDRKVAMSYKVTGYPSTVILPAPDASPVSRTGYINTEQMLMYVRFVEEKWYQSLSFEEWVQSEALMQQEGQKK